MLIQRFLLLVGGSLLCASAVLKVYFPSLSVFENAYYFAVTFALATVEILLGVLSFGAVLRTDGSLAKMSMTLMALFFLLDLVTEHG
jgi:hypothetical protein